MGSLLLTVVAVVWLLSVFGAVSVIGAIGVTFVAMVVGIVFLDLTTRGSGKAIRDPNAPNFYGPIDGEPWQVPTAYIDHATGAGPPPGMGHDMEDIEKISGDRRPSREDDAP
jgi:hypothetical protein